MVEIVTPHAASRMQARLVDSLDPRVVRTTAGWWQGCDELGLPGYESSSNEGANHNRMIDNANPDPIGGCVAHKSYLCDVRKAAAAG